MFVAAFAAYLNGDRRASSATGEQSQSGTATDLGRSSPHRNDVSGLRDRRVDLSYRLTVRSNDNARCHLTSSCIFRATHHRFTSRTCGTCPRSLACSRRSIARTCVATICTPIPSFTSCGLRDVKATKRAPSSDVRSTECIRDLTDQRLLTGNLTALGRACQVDADGHFIAPRWSAAQWSCRPSF